VKLYIHKDEHGKWHGKALRAALDACEPGQYAVEIKRHSGRKTTHQNSYLHVLFGIVADTLNAEGMGDGKRWTVERVKEWCKAQGCYPVEDLTVKGHTVQVVKPTRELDKEEAMMTIDAVLRYWAEMGIVLPEPGEQMEMIPG
jgi:hypothetical protein